MTRLLLALGFTLFTIVTASSQSSGRVFRMAIVAPAGPVSNLTETGDLRDIFHELRYLGFVEGQNLMVERRSAGERPERIPELVREVIALKPDVIFTTSGRVLQAVKAATTAVPAVGFASDPVRVGLAASLARPGGNITGVSVDTGMEIYEKRLQVLRELVPGATKVAYLTPRDGWENIFWAATREGAQRLGLSLTAALLESPINEAEYRRVFAALVEQRPDAILVSDYNENMRHRHLIIELARVHRLPAIYPFRGFIEAGGMAAYGPDWSDLFRHLAKSIAAILGGTQPGEIPFYQATRFLLLVNPKSAHDIGFDIPPAILTMADEIVDGGVQ
jgi:putative tryptophan/tyrosine transport system substrate-binding protein